MRKIYILSAFLLFFVVSSPVGAVSLDVQDAAEQVIGSNEVDYAGQIYRQGMVVYDLTMQLRNLLAKDKKDKGEGETDPDELIGEKVDSLSYTDDPATRTEGDKSRKDKERSAENESNAIAVINSGATEVSSSGDEKTQHEDEAGASQTLNGKSEALQTAIDSTVNQMDALQNLLLLELKNLEARAAYLIAQNTSYTVDKSKLSASLDICSYTGEETSLLGSLNSLKETVGSVTSAASSAVSQAQQGVSSAIQTVSETKNDVAAAVGTVSSGADTLSSSVGGLEGMGI